MTVLRLTTSSGRVRVAAGGVDRVLVDGIEVPEVAGVVTVDAGNRATEIEVPAGAEVVAGTGSGRVSIRGPVGLVGVSSASGRVQVEQATEIDVRTESVAVAVGSCAGTCRVRTRSGRVEVEQATEIDVHTESGRVVVGDVTGEVVVRTTSGRVDIGLSGAGPVVAETVSGRIGLAVARGVGARVDVQSRQGRVDNTVTPGDDRPVRVATVSGRVRVRTA